MNEIKNHGKKWFYWFSLGVAIIAVYKVLDNFTSIVGALNTFIKILEPFIAGIFIAYLLYVPCKKFEQLFRKAKFRLIRRKSRAFGIFVTYLIAFIIILLLFNFIIPVVLNSVTDLLNNFQNYYNSAIEKYNNLPEDSILKTEYVKDIIKNIENLDLKKYFELDRIMEYIMRALNIVSGIFNIFVSLIVSIYILSGRNRIIKFLKRFVAAMFKEKTYKNIDKYFNNSNEIFFKFVASQVFDGFIVGILVTIALLIMKVKYAPLLGFIIGLFNIIPYFGAIIAVAIATLITLITGGLSQTIWMVIITIILQQIDANIINPKIVGQSLKISPLLVIFAVTIGGAYCGLLGMFLAVPVIAVIRIVVVDYINLKLMLKKQETEIEPQ